MKLSDLTSRFRNGGSVADSDLGFGNKIGASGERLINLDGSYNVIRSGASAWTPYQLLVEMSWWRFLWLVIAFYVGVNTLFAIGFMLIGVENLSGISGSDGALHNFAEAFFFSVQTFTTVGYGSMSPLNIATNLLASLVALVGLMSLALATGLFFARFSKPRAQIAHSDKLLVSPYHDTDYQSLQFRIANVRDNKLINLQATVVLSWTECIDQKRHRRFASLSLERSAVTLFPLNWTIVHIIDENSPLTGWSKTDYIDRQVEVLALIEGYDETFAQNVHLMRSYDVQQVVWNARFVPMYRAERGVTYLNLDCISEYKYIND